MNETAKLLSRGILHSLTGLGVQGASAGLLAWLTFLDAHGLDRHVFWASLAGLLIWLHLLLTYWLLHQEARFAISHDRKTPAAEGPGSDETKRERIRWIHRSYQRFGVPVMELGGAALLFHSLLAGLSPTASAAVGAPPGNLLLVALYSVATLLFIIFGVYMSTLIQVSAWRLFQSVRNYTSLMAVMLFSLLAGACFKHFGITQLTPILDWGLTAVNTLLFLEILLSMGLRVFSPRRPGDLPRPAFDFYLLEGLSRPMRMEETFAAMLESIFGFDITRTSFGKLVRALILPAVFLNTVLLLGLSAIVIVQPYEQAIVLDLGRLNRQPLDSGLHFKLPWPLSSVRHYNVDQIRSIHVGSHRPDQADGTIYREGVPILWTNMHGLNIDELLICSSPQDRSPAAAANKKNNTGAHKVPSVSLAAADVHIQFVIKELTAYVRSSATPELFLRKAAETCASQFIYHYDIDALFCDARLTLADKIRRAVQDKCDQQHLGIKIVHASITAVHPPVEVAGAFEETVAAMQERETKIQYARQKAVRSQVEATGSAEAFARLTALADGVDSGRGADVANHERLLHECGGEVAQILAAAESYRFSRENLERGKTERFDEQLGAHAASPRNYRYDQYFSILEKGLAVNRKVVLLGDTDKTILRMGLEPSAGMGLLTEEMDF